MTDSVAVFPPGFRVSDSAGFVNGASIEFYDSLTLNPKLVYSDQALINSLGAVVYTDSAGAPVSAQGGTNKVLVYTNTADYKIIIKDALGVPIFPFDGVKGAVISGGVGGGAVGITQAQADARYIRNVNALVAATNVDATDLLPFWDTATSSNQGIRWDDFQTDLLSEWRTAGHIFATGAVVTTVFRQPTAPTSWTKLTTVNDAGLRVVSGTIVDGGTTNYSVAWPAVTPSGTVGGSSLSIAQLAVHTHGFVVNGNAIGGSGIAAQSDKSGTQFTATTLAAGSGTTHTHAFTGNALAAILPKFVDVIFASKN